MTPMAEDYNIAVIHQLLRDAFTPDDFADFCFDHFRQVYRSFTDNQTQQQRVRLLIDFVETHRQIDTLLEKIREVRPARYAEFVAQLKVEPGHSHDNMSTPRPDFTINEESVRQYLKAFVERMDDLNHRGLKPHAFIPPRGVEPEGRLSGLDYEPEVESQPQFIRRIRRCVRELRGLSKGGNHTTAQLASLDHPSRRVRDVVRVLERDNHPVVLLGDPGSGKSMTVRQVAREIARREVKRKRARVVVYVRLG